jgi:hypothetical protein
MIRTGRQPTNSPAQDLESKPAKKKEAREREREREIREVGETLSSSQILLTPRGRRSERTGDGGVGGGEAQGPLGLAGQRRGAVGAQLCSYPLPPTPTPLAPPLVLAISLFYLVGVKSCGSNPWR